MADDAQAALAKALTDYVQGEDKVRLVDLLEAPRTRRLFRALLAA